MRTRFPETLETDMTQSPTELSAWRIANDLRIAQQRAAADAEYEKLLADNPVFAAHIPALEKLAGFYAAAVSA
jgi:hypothetical protein